jgi:hypothetical protein
MKHSLKITALCLLAVSLHCVSTYAADLEITAAKLYGYAPATGMMYLYDKKIKVKAGERIEFSAYDPLDGLAPDFFDVEVTAKNNGPATVKNVEVRLSLTPKVASLVFFPGLVGSGFDASTADHEKTEQTAQWFAPTLVIQKTILQVAAGMSAKVVFDKINLAEIIRSYENRKLWPMELRIDASIEPKESEINLRNNSTTRNLKINLPPY